MGKYKTLTKNTLLFTIGNMGTKVISFLLVPLYTAVLSTEEYGVSDLITTTVALLVPIITLNVQDAVLRFGLDDKYNQEKVLKTSFFVCAIGNIVLQLLVIFLIVLNIISVEPVYVVYTLLTTLFSSICNIASMYIKTINKVHLIVAAGIASTLTICLLNIVLLVFFESGIVGFLFSNLMGYVVTALVLIIGGKQWKGSLVYFDKKILRQMIFYSAPLVFNSIAWWINNASDKYIVSLFLGISSNGIYSVAYKIPSILAMIQSIFYNAWSISAIQEFDKNDNDGFLGNIYVMYSSITIMMCSIIIMLNQPLASFLYSNDFYNAWKYVPVLLLGTLFNGLALFEGCLYTAVKKTKDIMKTTLLGAFVNTILNFVLIPVIGVLGAGMATMIGYFVVWLIRTIRLRNFVELRVNWWKHAILIFLLLVQAAVASTIICLPLQVLIIVLIIVLQVKEILAVIKWMIKKRVR